MNKKYWLFVSAFALVFCSLFVSASVGILSPVNNVEVIQNQSLVFRANVVCDKDVCNNFSVGLVIPDLESVNYDFSNNLSDCFDGVCLSKPSGNGPLNISSGQGSWACGQCFSGPVFIGKNMRNLTTVFSPNGCMTGLADIVGVSLCFKAGDNNLWNVVFSSWPAGGGGRDFVYTRTKEKGLIGTSQDSLPFFINSSGNPLVLSLTKDQSQEVSFSVVAKGTIGETFGLKVFFGDQLSEAVNVKINDSEEDVETGDTDSKVTHHHSASRSSEDNSIFISDSVPGGETTLSTGEDVLALTNLPATDKSKGMEGYIILGIVILAVIVCLLVLLFLRLRK